jgi:F0F1-type ATP synthase gamma subunit
MNTITNTQKLVAKNDLVIIPRKEYEAFREYKKNIKEFTPTLADKRALARAENNFRKGKTLSYDELVRKLGLGG